MYISCFGLFIDIIKFNLMHHDPRCFIIPPLLPDCEPSFFIQHQCAKVQSDGCAPQSVIAPYSLHRFTK